MKFLFDRQKKGERALLVLPLAPRGVDSERRTEEFTELARSAGAEVLERIVARTDRPNPRYFIGRGKVDEVAEKLQRLEADLVLVDHILSPVQERNLEQRLGVRVIDRPRLILDIFAQRAHSHEGKLEVELAQLRHLATRLVGGWTHLERQRGGGIGLRGPGETQLETDRRLLGARVKILTRRLDKVRMQRHQQSRARRRAALPRVALVGYTNAGKSSLFNTLTEAGVYTADKLFATLDPMVRRIENPDCGPLMLSDTVGFVRELPHDLIAAFRATLSEAREADLLLHVVDSADAEQQAMQTIVNNVLEEIGAGDLPQLLVMNKIDLNGHVPQVDRDTAGVPQRVWLSAVGGDGVDALYKTIAERVGGERVCGLLRLPAAEGRLRARLIELGAVRGEQYDEQGWVLQVDAPRSRLEPLLGHNLDDCLGPLLARVE